MYTKIHFQRLKQSLNTATKFRATGYCCLFSSHIVFDFDFASFRFSCFPEQTEVFMKPGKIQTRPKNGLDIFLTKQPRMNPNPLLEAYTPPGKLRNFFSAESIDIWCLV